jgi:FkbM family methyltransferase
MLEGRGIPRALRTLVDGAARRLNIGITTYSRLQDIEERRLEGIDDVLGFGERHAVPLLRLLRSSKAQLFQDLFVLSELDLKRDGFFVEFGATNGVDMNNTHLLENGFGWKGIISEPAKCWHPALMNNRKCHIDTDCVWRESNATLTFLETSGGEFSTIDSFTSSDKNARFRKRGVRYTVKTISLQDLLNKYEAPEIIDYLSIDTEGSEYEILSDFDFARYQFRVITCEHNFSPRREQIFSLLTEKGYVRKYEQYSQFDDWYVKADLI